MQTLKPIQWCRCVLIRAEISEPSQPAHLVLKYMHDSNLMPIRLVTLLLDSAIEANCHQKNVGHSCSSVPCLKSLLQPLIPWITVKSCVILMETMIGVEKAMATHSSTFAWKIPWTEEPGRLQSMELLRVRHDWATSLSLFTFLRWRRKWQPTPVFLPGPRDGGAWWAAIYGVAQSWTRLKRLSCCSSSSMIRVAKYFISFSNFTIFIFFKFI